MFRLLRFWFHTALSSQVKASWTHNLAASASTDGHGLNGKKKGQAATVTLSATWKASWITTTYVVARPFGSFRTNGNVLLGIPAKQLAKQAVQSKNIQEFSKLKDLKA